MKTGLDDMTALTKAQFMAKQAELEPILAEERRLRRALADLDQGIRESASLPPEKLRDLQRLGGDMAWRRWAARARSDLHIRLARVLAVKASKMADLRQAFGRAEAVATLTRQQAQKKAYDRQKADLDALQRLACLTHSKS